MSSPDPRSGIGILPRGFCHLSFPLSSRTKFSRSIPKPVLSSCRLYTGCHRDRKQVSSRLILEHRLDSSFDSAFNGLTMRHRTVCFHSSPQHSPDVLSGRLFLSRSPPHLLNAAALRQFEACSCKPTSGGQLPSLIQHHELTLVFVTHCRSSARNFCFGWSNGIGRNFGESLSSATLDTKHNHGQDCENQIQNRDRAKRPKRPRCRPEG